MTNRLYHAFKMSVDGNHSKWGFVPDLTLSEAIDFKRFPTGLQRESDGRAYIWTYAFMPRVVEMAERGFRAIRASKPVPSATSAILQKLAR